MLFPLQPLLADSEIPFQAWIVVVMVFIAFIRWVIEKLKGPQEEPDFSEFEEEFEQPRQQTAPPPLPNQPAPAGGGGDPAAELRKFLEQLGGEEESAPPPAQKSPKVSKKKAKSGPPPLEPAKQELSKAEKEALKRLKAAQKEPVYGVTAPAPAAGIAQGSLRAMLASPEAVRNAVVLKEILDRPKALRAKESPGF